MYVYMAAELREEFDPRDVVEACATARTSTTLTRRVIYLVCSITAVSYVCIILMYSDASELLVQGCERDGWILHRVFFCLHILVHLVIYDSG